MPLMSDFFNRQLVESQYLNNEDSNCLAHTPEPKGAIPYWQWQKLGEKKKNEYFVWQMHELLHGKVAKFSIVQEE